MIVIALGGNLPSAAGPPAQTMAAALEELAQRGIRPVAVSPFYETDAWPDPSDPTFVNAVALVATSLQPEALMKELQKTEDKFGRVRGRPNAPRTLDIDLIDYDGLIREQIPTLPHPRMEGRTFVLAPLKDVAPNWRHPANGKSVSELLAALPESKRMLKELGKA